MDTEFHYWMTGIIARHAGFSEDEAKIIAYASEFVDENDISITVRNKDGHKEYSNFISQTMNILKPKQQLMRIYPIFHFVPGEPDADTARRRDGKMHMLNTTPNNENANMLLDEAFKAPEDTRLYRIGIATHAYADTWAHQNFVGWYDYFNNIGFDPKPDIGHADGEHHPDWPGHRWTDPRLVDGEIDNNHRFISAAECLFQKYCAYLASTGREDKSNQWSNLESQLGEMMGRTTSGSKNYGEEQRLQAYTGLAPWLPGFDEADWFDKAIWTDVRGRRDSCKGLKAKFTLLYDQYFWLDEDQKENSHWYRFQEAVKDHERLALVKFDDLFKKMGVNLHQT